MPVSSLGKLKRARVGGSRFTAFYWNNKALLFARQVSHTSPAPVGPGAVAIQPLDSLRPAEIITPAAIGMGQITLELYETYNSKVWDEFISALGGLRGNPTASTAVGDPGRLNDLSDIFQFLADIGEAITLQKHVLPPLGTGVAAYSEVYHNCVITNMMDGETIEIGTMEVLKQITVGYTKVTRSNGKTYNSRGV